MFKRNTYYTSVNEMIHLVEKLHKTSNASIHNTIMIVSIINFRVKFRIASKQCSEVNKRLKSIPAMLADNINTASNNKLKRKNYIQKHNAVYTVSLNMKAYSQLYKVFIRIKRFIST